MSAATNTNSSINNQVKKARKSIFKYKLDSNFKDFNQENAPY